MIALAAILGVPLPDDLRHEVGGIFDAVSFLANRAAKLVRTADRFLITGREFAIDFGERHSKSRAGLPRRRMLASSA